MRGYDGVAGGGGDDRGDRQMERNSEVGAWG